MASVSLRRSWTPGESRFTQEQWEVTSHLLGWLLSRWRAGGEVAGADAGEGVCSASLRAAGQVVKCSAVVRAGGSHTVECGLNPPSTTSASGYIPERFENRVKAGYCSADKSVDR